MVLCITGGARGRSYPGRGHKGQQKQDKGSQDLPGFGAHLAVGTLVNMGVLRGSFHFLHVLISSV